MKDQGCRAAVRQSYMIAPCGLPAPLVAEVNGAVVVLCGSHEAMAAVGMVEIAPERQLP
jgi:hypothetical protein